MAIAPILSWEGLGLIQGSGWLFKDLDINIGPRDRLALIGYDITRFLLSTMDAAEGDLADGIRSASLYDGIGHRFRFGGGQVNEALYVLGFRDGQAVLLE